MPAFVAEERRDRALAQRRIWRPAMVVALGAASRFDELISLASETLRGG